MFVYWADVPAESYKLPSHRQCVDVTSNPKMTTQSPENISRQLRTWTLIISVLSVLSLFSVTMTTLAWGTGDTTILFLLLYPALIISTILVIAKRRFGYILTLGIAISYAVLLTTHVGQFFIFDFNNSVLLLVLVLPYLAVLALIPLTTAFLFDRHKKGKTVIVASLIIALCIPLFSIAERANMDYRDSIFAEFTTDSSGVIKVTCKPQPSDTRIFYLTSSSKELADVAKTEGTFLLDYYYVANTIIEKNCRFRKLQLLTIKKLNNKELRQPLTWKVDEIKGDISFLEP